MSSGKHYVHFSLMKKELLVFIQLREDARYYRMNIVEGLAVIHCDLDFRSCLPLSV